VVVAVTANVLSLRNGLQRGTYGSAKRVGGSSPKREVFRVAGRQQIERDVADHVFLAADQPASADLDEDAAHVEAVLLRGAFGVAQKAGVTPAYASRCVIGASDIPRHGGHDTAVSGGDDAEVARWFAGSPLDVGRLTGAPPAASALKLTYAAWTKTKVALLVSIRRTAAALVVQDDLANEWAIPARPSRGLALGPAASWSRRAVRRGDQRAPREPGGRVMPSGGRGAGVEAVLGEKRIGDFAAGIVA
jgi:hypothetical protein